MSDESVGPTRIKLVVSYDGTDFRGWAAQTGQRTVQSTLTEAVRQVSGEEVEIVGASRTDSGAHARGQVCHFDTGTPIKPHKWQMALNRVLPLDLSVRTCTLERESFHSRFCAQDRFYRYRLALGIRDPLKSRFVHQYWNALDIDAMRRAAKPLLGKHDFRAFTEELDPSVDNTTRRLFAVEVKAVQDEVWIDVVGTAFLRGMMRRIAGCLFEIGRGIRDEKDTDLLLTPRWQEMHLPAVLPARGLTLMRIRYGRHPRDNRIASSED